MKYNSVLRLSKTKSFPRVDSERKKGVVLFHDFCHCCESEQAGGR